MPLEVLLIILVCTIIGLLLLPTIFRRCFSSGLDSNASSNKRPLIAGARPNPVGHDVRSEESWLYTGARVWNACIVVLGLMFCLEAFIFLLLGNHEAHADTRDVTPHGSVAYVTQDDVENFMGNALAVIAGLSIITASLQLCGRFTRRHGQVYRISCAIVLALEVGLLYATVVLANFKSFSETFPDLRVAELDSTVHKCIWLVAPEIFVAIFMQVGAIVFHNAIASAEDPDTTGVSAPGQIGAGLEPRHVKRLESMRSYYAQLYLENGLDIPRELLDGQGHEG
jgi:hypothetical protein